MLATFIWHGLSQQSCVPVFVVTWEYPPAGAPSPPPRTPRTSPAARCPGAWGGGRQHCQGSSAPDHDAAGGRGAPPLPALVAEVRAAAGRQLLHPAAPVPHVLQAVVTHQTTLTVILRPHGAFDVEFVLKNLRQDMVTITTIHLWPDMRAPGPTTMGSPSSTVSAGTRAAARLSPTTPAAPPAQATPTWPGRSWAPASSPPGPWRTSA